MAVQQSAAPALVPAFGLAKQSKPEYKLPADYEPRANDVKCGRGKSCRDHTGNQRFRELIQTKVEAYSNASGKVEKGSILQGIIQTVRSGSDGEEPAYFIKQDPTTGRWFDVGDFQAREKASQNFRDFLHERYSSSNVTKNAKRKVKKNLAASSCNNPMFGAPSSTQSKRRRLDNESPLKHFPSPGRRTCGTGPQLQAPVAQHPYMQLSGFPMAPQLNAPGLDPILAARAAVAAYHRPSLPASSSGLPFSLGGGGMDLVRAQQQQLQIQQLQEQLVLRRGGDGAARAEPPLARAASFPAAAAAGLSAPPPTDQRSLMLRALLLQQRQQVVGQQQQASALQQRIAHLQKLQALMQQQPHRNSF